MAGNMYGNNGAPTGYGQPRKGVHRRALVDPQTEQQLGGGGMGHHVMPRSYGMPVGEPVEAPQQETPATPAPPAFRDGAQTGQYGRGTPVGNMNINNFEGMVMDRALSGGDPKSAKDAFTRAAAQYNRPLTDVKDDYGSAEEYLNGMMDLMRQEGLNVQGVKGGKILVDSFENPGSYNWVDVIRGAGGDNPAFWWGHDLGGSPASKVQAPANGLYNQVQQSILGQQPQGQQFMGGLDTSNLDQMLQFLLQQGQQIGI